MTELMMVAVFLAMGAALVFGWRALSRTDQELVDDARSTVLPGPNGTMTVVVANPASEAVVVTACARPAAALRWFGKDHLIRGLNQQERRNSARASRQLLGTVPAGDQTTWVVTGEATESRVCKVILSVYQPNGRVRVHEHLVHANPVVATPTTVARHRPVVRRHHHSATD
jgi:hypothetical protein